MLLLAFPPESNAVQSSILSTQSLPRKAPCILQPTKSCPNKHQSPNTTLPRYRYSSTPSQRIHREPTMRTSKKEENQKSLTKSSMELFNRKSRFKLKILKWSNLMSPRKQYLSSATNRYQIQDLQPTFL